MMKMFLAGALIALPSMASAQAIISNGTVGLGVDTAGQLNVRGTPSATNTTDFYGIRDIATNFEATADGCLCEGWGAAIAGTGTTVFANNSAGSLFNAISFASTATTATSVVGSVDGALRVTHAYSPSAAANLYQVDVTITNTSGADFTGATLYRRAMDWDIEPTAFREYSTIQGTTGAANITFASNNGFASTNPFTGPSDNGAVGDFVDYGPTDQGALFDFSFDPLRAGASQTLTIYFGAANTEAAALAALGLVGAEAYSFGQSADNMDGSTANRPTFIFGFKGVGGVTLPGAVPEPATWAMMIGGFGMVGGAMRRRRTAGTLATA